DVASKSEMVASFRQSCFMDPPLKDPRRELTHTPSARRPAQGVQACEYRCLRIATDLMNRLHVG
ncbi:MAG: hypothetical protein ACRD3T_18015, partial [Terriglobia bacterium]